MTPPSRPQIHSTTHRSSQNTWIIPVARAHWIWLENCIQGQPARTVKTIWNIDADMLHTITIIKITPSAAELLALAPFNQTKWITKHRHTWHTQPVFQLPLRTNTWHLFPSTLCPPRRNTTCVNSFTQTYFGSRRLKPQETAWVWSTPVYNTLVLGCQTNCWHVPHTIIQGGCETKSVY